MRSCTSRLASVGTRSAPRSPGAQGRGRGFSALASTVARRCEAAAKPGAAAQVCSGLWRLLLLGAPSFVPFCRLPLCKGEGPAAGASQRGTTGELDCLARTKSGFFRADGPRPRAHSAARGSTSSVPADGVPSAREALRSEPLAWQCGSLVGSPGLPRRCTPADALLSARRKRGCDHLGRGACLPPHCLAGEGFAFRRWEPLTLHSFVSLETAFKSKVLFERLAF